MSSSHSFLPANWRELPDEDLLQLRELLERAEYKKGLKIRPWRETARPKQLSPDDPGHHAQWSHPDTGITYQCQDPRCKAGEIDKNWNTWLVMSGRGTGKTWQASNWLLEQALAHDNTYWAVCGPTYADIRSVQIEGTTGIKKAALPGDIEDYNRNNQEIRLRNGSMIIGCSAEKPESPRGHNFAGGWLDELCAIEREEFFHDGLMPALRTGDNPKLLITTTPRRTRLIRELVRNADNSDYNIHVTRSATMENPYFSKMRLKELETRYKGTHLYRQELLGELLEDTAGALFTLDMISAARIRKDELPESLARVVVAIDPAMRSGNRSDASGIIVAAEDGDGHAYVLADRSIKGSPEQVMRTAVQAYHEFGADTIVCESNQGGDYLDSALKAVDPMLSIRKVHAMRGKFIRAEPVAMLYEQGRVHHVGSAADFQELEDQMCNVTKDGDRNAIADDRADSLCWAITELKGLTQGSYMTAYGLAKCEKCDATLKKTTLVCPGCGHKRDLAFPDKEAYIKPETSAADRHWADTYAKTCDDCHNPYPRDLSKCPKCYPSPEEFLASVAAFSGTAQPVKTGNLAGLWKRSTYR